jgi:hypothetical protein
MTVRASHKTVTFTRPFSLNGIDEVQPAGSYTVETRGGFASGFVGSRLAPIASCPGDPEAPSWSRWSTLIHWSWKQLRKEMPRSGSWKARSVISTAGST